MPEVAGAEPTVDRSQLAAATGRRRRRLAILVVGVAVLSAAGGAIVGSRLQSPADAAADREPPPASRITVPIERRQLTSTLVLAGEIAYQEPTPIRLSGAVDAGEGQTAVVTRPPVIGQELDEGDVFADVSGRPVFMLVGERPMYRSLTPGMTGDDVRQLEESLERLGFDIGAADGVYDLATEGAVAELYRAQGYTASFPTAEDEERLQTLRQAVTQAEGTVRDAYSALITAQAGKTETEMLELRQGVDQARDNLTAARATYRAVPPGMNAATELAALRAAEDAVELAELRLSEAEAPPDVSSEVAAMEAANMNLEQARADRDAADAATGIKVPAGEVVFVSDLPLTVTDVSATAGGATTGTIATMSSTASEVVGRVARSDADLIALGQVVSITVRGTNESVPGTVTYVGPPRETETSEDGDDGGSGGSSSPSRLEVVVTPDDPDALADDVFASVRIEVEIGSTTGEVLTVPLAAVFVAGGGDSQIEIEREPITAQSEGSTEIVDVNVGLTAEGLVEIDGVDVELAEGDRVVVGLQERATPDSTTDDATADDDASDDADASDEGSGSTDGG
ncbi:MAG: peptidoglycan-binding protein [Desertimonas sp.]